MTGRVRSPLDGRPASHRDEVLRSPVLSVREKQSTPPRGLVSLRRDVGTGRVSAVLAGAVISMVPVLVVGRGLREGLTAGAST